jgi:hypothetical protein
MLRMSWDSQVIEVGTILYISQGIPGERNGVHERLMMLDNYSERGILSNPERLETGTE